MLRGGGTDRRAQQGQLGIESSIKRTCPIFQFRPSLSRCAADGSPGLHANWRDEGLNRVLATIGAMAHRSVWQYRVLEYFEAAQSRKRARA
eukprot:7921748-Alexandrium_andersonii.AAC.1